MPGWADVVDVATITEPEHLDALDSKLDLDRRLRRSPGSSGSSAIRCGCSCCASTGSTSRSPSPWDDAYGGCTSWVDLAGLPADPGAAPVAPGALRRRVRGQAQGRPRALPAALA